MCKAQGARADSLSDRSPTRLRGGGRLDKRSRRLHEATSLVFSHRLAGSACLSRWQVLEITTGATKEEAAGVRRSRLRRPPQQQGGGWAGPITGGRLEEGSVGNKEG